VTDALVVAMTRMIREGDPDALAALLTAHPELAAERFGDAEMSRTAVHIATDWPGHFPRVAETIRVLVRAGAPADGRFAGPHQETPLHWAASADDLDAIDALLDEGADIEAPGAVFTGGTPLSDAVVFAQWAAARRLVERGAVMALWQAAALGETARVSTLLATAPPAADITNACWHACRAGHLPTAQQLVAAGADLDWLGHDDLTCRQAGLASGSAELATWLSGRPIR
jgi:hypothetical protein